MRVDSTLTALADPTRRAICQRLAHGRATLGQLAGLFPVSRPAVSQHVRVLVEADLVRPGEGRQSPYELDPEALIVLEAWLSKLVDTWRRAPLPRIAAQREATRSTQSPGGPRR
jgi:DNA-binding transcriptional ArsR family regulator